MRARLPLIVGLVAWSLTPAHAQDAKTVVAQASKAMGAANLTSIMLAGDAVQGNFGQSRTITFGLASTNIRNYRNTIDFTTSAMHATGDGAPGAPGRRGGPPPPAAPYELTVTAASPVAGAVSHLGNAVGIPARRRRERGVGTRHED